MSTDCRIAWREIALPNKVKNGETVDEWWPLNGKLGDEMEGAVHLLISKKVWTLFISYVLTVIVYVRCVNTMFIRDFWMIAFTYL